MIIEDVGTMDDWNAGRLSTDERRQHNRERYERMAREMAEERRNTERRELTELSTRPEPLYRIICGEDIDVLQDKVDFLLSLEWNLNGGVMHLDKRGYRQAMSKPRTEPITPESDNHFNDVEFNL